MRLLKAKPQPLTTCQVMDLLGIFFSVLGLFLGPLLDCFGPILVFQTLESMDLRMNNNKYSLAWTIHEIQKVVF
jgi:hypothetical protein